MYSFNQTDFRMFLRYIIGIGVIFALIYFFQQQDNMMSIFWKFNFSRLYPVCVVILMHLAVLYYIWRSIILDIGSMNIDEHLIFHSFLGGRTLGFITPGHMGELLKGLFFSAGSRMEATSLSMIYAGYGLIVNIVLGCIGCVYFVYKLPQAFNIFYQSIFFPMTMLILGGVIILLGREVKLKKNISRLLPEQVTELLWVIKNQIQTNSPLRLFNLFLLALAANLLAALGFMLLMDGFNIHVFNIDGLMAFEAAYLTMYLLPITPSGMGIREGSRVYFFSLIGCSPATVLLASFIMFGLNIIFPAIVGIWSMRYFWTKPPQIK